MEIHDIRYDQSLTHTTYRIDTDLGVLFRFWVLRMMFDLVAGDDRE